MNLKDNVYVNITTVNSEKHFSKNLFHIETSQLICIANQITDFYMIQGISKQTLVWSNMLLI